MGWVDLRVPEVSPEFDSRLGTPYSVVDRKLLGWITVRLNEHCTVISIIKGIGSADDYFLKDYKAESELSVHVRLVFKRYGIFDAEDGGPRSPTFYSIYPPTRVTILIQIAFVGTITYLPRLPFTETKSPPNAHHQQGCIIRTVPFIFNVVVTHIRGKK